MPNPEIIPREGRGRSPAAQRSQRDERRSKTRSHRERHREKGRSSSSSSSRRKKHKQARERQQQQPWQQQDVVYDRDARTLVEYDDVSSQSERFSGSPSPRTDTLSVDRLSEAEFQDSSIGGAATPDRKSRRDHNSSHARKEETRASSEKSRQEMKRKERSRERDAAIKSRSGVRNHDSNGRKPSSATSDKKESKRHKNKSKAEKDPPSAYRETPQAYRDDREELRAYRRSSPSLTTTESPYGTSYPYGYQSPNANYPFISRRSPRRLSPNTTYYGRDSELYAPYVAKSPSSYSSSKRKRSPTSPCWRRSPSYGRHSPYEQGEFTASPYGQRRRSRSPSPDVR